MDVLDTFTVQERLFFQRLAGSIISQKQDMNVPGADDNAIFSALLLRAEATKYMRDNMADFLASFGGLETVANLDDAAFTQWVGEVQTAQHRFLTTTLALLAQTYYQHPTVLAALGIDGGPPFPRGNKLEQGDWSLLDPVKNRKPFFREC